MDSLFNYKSDEENGDDTDKFNMYKSKETVEVLQLQELDVNYDNVTMEMSEESASDQEPDDLEKKVEKEQPPPPSSSSSSSELTSSSDSETSKRRQKQSNSTNRESRRVRRSRSSSSRKSLDQKKSSTNVKLYRKNIENTHDIKRHPSEYRDDRKHESHRSRRRRRSPSPHRRDRSTERYRDRSRSPYRHGRSYGSYGSSHYHSKRDRDDYRKKRPSRSSKRRNKLNALGRLGIDLGGSSAALHRSIQDEINKVKDSTGIALPSYYNPIAVNPSKYADQMQKRKKLWSGGTKNNNNNSASTEEPTEGEDKSKSSTVGPPTVWQKAKFLQDQDGKLTAKFQRLMGIKNTVIGENQEVNCTVTSSTETSGGEDLIKKQEEMFNSMEMQYEVARVATHTHRGLGLGFGLHQYPR